MKTGPTACLLILALFSAFTAAGAPNRALVITSATADAELLSLHIEGANFCAAPVVTLNDTIQLAVSLAAPASIDAALPAIGPGSYLLKVSCGETTALNASFVVILGPVQGFGISSLSAVHTFPPGGQLTVYDANIHAASLLLLNYVNGSRGNALSIDSQSEGQATFSGSPNKQFRYAVIDSY